MSVTWNDKTQPTVGPVCSYSEGHVAMVRSIISVSQDLLFSSCRMVFLTLVRWPLISETGSSRRCSFSTVRLLHTLCFWKSKHFIVVTDKIERGILKGMFKVNDPFKVICLNWKREQMGERGQPFYLALLGKLSTSVSPASSPSALRQSPPSACYVSSFCMPSNMNKLFSLKYS